MANDVRERFTRLLEDSQPDGVTSQMLNQNFKGDAFSALVPVINEMLGENRLEMFRLEGGRDVVYKLRGEEEAATRSELTNEQLLVLQVVERTENAGIWLRDIKSATSMQQQTLNKALKVLESRKLVKTVRSVQQKTKKLYMSYDLMPTREVSGGPWYTDQEFDHEFVEHISTFVERLVESQQHLPLDEIHRVIKGANVSNVELSVDDIRLVVETLLADAKLEEMRFAGATHYKIAKQSVDVFLGCADIECPRPLRSAPF